MQRLPKLPLALATGLLAAGSASAQVYYATSNAGGSDNWRLDIPTGVSAGPEWTGCGPRAVADDDAAQVYYLSLVWSLFTAPYGGGPATALAGNTTYMGSNVAYTGLAQNGGVLYGTHNASASGLTEGLYAIDLVTLDATITHTFTNQEIALEGVDFDPTTGLLYGANDGAAYIDPQGTPGRGVVVVDLAATPVSEVTMYAYPPGENDLDALALDPAGWCYLIEDEPSPLHTFDLATGTYISNPAINAATTSEIYSGATYTTNAAPGLGTNYCVAAINSTGVGATMSASGSPSVAANNVTLEATNLPFNSFGFFLTSTMQGMALNPGGSQGTLCLAGSIGRFVGPGQIQNSGSVGSISLALDLAQQPTPTGLVQVAAGQTWNFQAWYRDVTTSGTATSNFTNGLEIAFN